MKIELGTDNRRKYRENHTILDKIREKIAFRINQEYISETSTLRNENEDLIKEEKQFHNQVKNFLKAVSKLDRFTIETQVGRESEIINQYTGVIDKVGENYFNFIDLNVHEGKPFTVGFSCLLSIEKVNI